MVAIAGRQHSETESDSFTGQILGLVHPAFPEDDCHAPRAARQRTLIRAAMRTPGLGSQGVIVRNVSERGMRVVARGFHAQVTERLSFTLPGDIEVQAQVRWVKGEEFGVELSADLDLLRLGLTNQRRHAPVCAQVVHWLVDERLRRPDQQESPTLRFC